ncbi:MAG: Molybdenum cofactor cytidylyltransferase [Syntrophorhabdaceae bacterium PtaU1.Bin034]|nr:MAG: Molybdenum cofactor cytidylyltransferase [Syntrophorhabdaceae bacterium PtaU1.Bin034]
MLRITTIILAAGASRRLGFNKLCVRLNGEAVIRRTVRLFMETQASRIVVVTGFEKERVERELAGLPVIFAHNERHEEGMSGSIRAALPEISASDLAFFHLGDKPFFDPGIIDRMIKMYETEKYPIIISVHNGIKGHPVLVDVGKHWSAIAAVEGEGGLREVVAAHPGDVRFIEGGEGSILDLDTDDDISLLIRRGYTVEKG